jgi:hypothetical protein
MLCRFINRRLDGCPDFTLGTSALFHLSTAIALFWQSVNARSFGVAQSFLQSAHDSHGLDAQLTTLDLWLAVGWRWPELIGSAIVSEYPWSFYEPVDLLVAASLFPHEPENTSIFGTQEPLDVDLWLRKGGWGGYSCLRTPPYSSISCSGWRYSSIRDSIKVLYQWFSNWVPQNPEVPRRRVSGSAKRW